jgi:hypothetical protein
METENNTLMISLKEVSKLNVFSILFLFML